MEKQRIFSFKSRALYLFLINNTNIIYIMLSFFILIRSSLAAAYIPEYNLILSKTAEQHGSGLYQIDQDVIFHVTDEPLVVHETWWIANENMMKVQIEGRNSLKGIVQGVLIYDQQKKYWFDNTVQSKRLGEDWIEPYFYFRVSKNMKNHLVAVKITPPTSLKDRVTIPSPTGEFKYQPQPFIGLSRVLGSISYVIGIPAKDPSSGYTSGIWIEQDQFVVRKLKLPSQATVTTEDYFRQPEGLWLPKTRSVTWENKSVQIQLNRVQTLGKNNFKNGELFKTSSLEKKQNTPSPKWSDQDLIREFYNRFR
ncbi:MAG: hypothetical protein K1X29_06520 [Bdellovibrionales bacterium]|nr:hypothetical protein [Bdellovibrionales bacterium]